MENIKNIPDVDLSGVVDDLQDTTTGDKTGGQQKGDNLNLPPFKAQEDFVKSYKELQRVISKLSEETKTKDQQLAEMVEQMEMLKYSAPPVNQGGSGYYTPSEEPIEQQIHRTVLTQRIAEILEEESDKNKVEFQERYAYAQMVSKEYPQLGTSPKGVRKLFEMGDKLRNEHLKKNAGRALESIFGEPLGEEDINKLRTLVKGDKAIQQQLKNTNAYMPDTSTSTRSGLDATQKQNYDEKINESVEKGDVDGVLKGMFGSLLAE